MISGDVREKDVATAFVTWKCVSDKFSFRYTHKMKK